MNRTLSILISLGLTLSSVQAADGLFKLDQRIGTKRLRIMAGAEDAHKVSIPKTFLSKKHLFYLTVTATSDASLDMGIMSDVSYVSQEIEGSAVKVKLAAKVVGDPRSQVGQEVASFQAEVVGDAVKVDLSTDMAFRTEGGIYKAESPAVTRDIELTDSRLSYTQVFEMKNVEPASPDAPETITMGIRVYMIERENSGYQPKEYPAADRTKLGFFALSTFQGVFDNFPAGDYAMRWDISKPITYVLHPSVPEIYRTRISNAVLSWNKVFKATKGVEPVRVEISDDENLLPGDPDKSVVYWFGGNVPKMFLGQARPMTDPRTGEIFTSYVLLTESEFNGAVQNDQMFDMIRQAGQKKSQPVNLAFGNGMKILVLARCELLQNAGISQLLQLEDKFDPAAILARLMDNTVTHEVGHSLGLRHNFIGSADLVNHAADEDCTSVMDYVDAAHSPRTPQGYDFKAIAYGYDGQVPEEFNKTYAYASDEHAPTNPDANPHDLGEPYAHYTGLYRTFRRARMSIPQLNDPNLFGALMGMATGALPKFLGVPNHNRYQEAAEFFKKVLDSTGPAAEAGGTGGQPAMEIAPELAAAKNMAERSALFQALASHQEITYAPALQMELLKRIKTSFVDPEKTELFPVRIAAITGFIGFGQIGIMSLIQSVKEIAEFVEANPEAATIQQEMAILQIIQQLMQQGGGKEGIANMSPLAIRDLLSKELRDVTLTVQTGE